MMHYVISDVHAREILDSRGNPTVEAQEWQLCHQGRVPVNMKPWN